MINFDTLLEVPDWESTSAIQPKSEAEIVLYRAWALDQIKKRSKPKATKRSITETAEKLALVMSNLGDCLLSSENLSIPSTGTTSHFKELKLAQGALTTIKSIIVDTGMAHLVRSGFSFENKSYADSFYPTALFLSTFNLNLYPEPKAEDYFDYEPYQYKGTERWDVEEARKIRVIQDYNEFMYQFSWAKKAPTVRKLGVEPFTSGRLYTPFQNLPKRRKKIRDNTFLDNKPICEVDFAANHLTMLALMANQTMKTHHGANAYNKIIEDTGLDKKIVKGVINTCIGASKPLNEAQIAYKQPYGTKQASTVLDSLRKIYGWLFEYEFLFNGYGSKLQYLEGEIALKMMEWCVVENIPMLTLHDAYVVNARNGAVTFNEMIHQRSAVTTAARLRM